MFQKGILLGFALVVFFHSNLYSQSYVELKTFGKPGGFRFEVGEVMRFKLKGQKEISRGYIVDFPEDSVIRFYSGYVDVRDIDMVDMRTKQSNMEWNLAIAGAGYIGLELINSRIVQNRAFVFDKAVWVPSASLISSGFLIHWLKAKWFRVGLRKRVVIVKP